MADNGAVPFVEVGLNVIASVRRTVNRGVVVQRQAHPHLGTISVVFASSTSDESGRSSRNQLSPP
jgi:hypothetical protein